jgi:hypothetical protein
MSRFFTLSRLGFGFIFSLFISFALEVPAQASRSCKDLQGNFGLAPSCIPALKKACGDFAVCLKVSSQQCPNLPKVLSDTWWDYRECKKCESVAESLDDQVADCLKEVQRNKTAAQVKLEKTTCPGLPKMPQDCAPNGELPAKLISFDDGTGCNANQKNCPCIYKACEGGGFTAFSGCWSRKEHKNGAGQPGFEYCTQRSCLKTQPQSLTCYTN